MKKILLCLFFLSGCSTTLKKPLPPPDYERLSVLRNDFIQSESQIETANESEEIYIKFLKAKKFEQNGKNEESCSAYEDLKELDHFPLKELANIRAILLCPTSNSELSKFKVQTVPSKYLKEKWLENLLQKSLELGQLEIAGDMSFELLNFKSNKKEKIHLISNALQYAKTLNDQSRIKIFTKKLEELSPTMAPLYLKENYFQIAKEFESNRMFEKAREYYLDIINGDSELDDKIKSYNAYRTSFKIERRLSLFLEKTGEMELFLRQLLENDNKNTKLQEAWVEAKINYARAIWTEHMNFEARAQLDDILDSKLGSISQRANVLWIYGLLHSESQELEQAKNKFEKAFKLKIKNTDLEENIAWSLVWTSFRLKKHEEQIEYTTQIEKKTTNSLFLNKLLFWKAKAFQQMNKPEKAQEIFQQLTIEDFYGYYGIISNIELDQPFSNITPREIKPEPTQNLILDWLLATEEFTTANAYLKEIQPTYKTLDQKKELMSLYYKTNNFQNGSSLIVYFPEKNRNQIISDYHQLFFPIPFLEEYQNASLTFNLPLAYSLAISRQESNFNPNARSWADAFGLMQLIPEKSNELAKKHLITYSDFHDLLNPKTNIQLGTALLSDLKQKYRGKFVQVTAAYNASDSAISTWEKERFNGDFYEFIEMIPYEETRNYIKLVFRNYITYKKILSKEPFRINKNFFEIDFN
jgi:soluble lytic murein transglycosylase